MAVSKHIHFEVLISITKNNNVCFSFSPRPLAGGEGADIKIVATRCQILRLKCTKFDFGWSCAPDPAGGAYSTPPTRTTVV